MTMQESLKYNYKKFNKNEQQQWENKHQLCLTGDAFHEELRQTQDYLNWFRSLSFTYASTSQLLNDPRQHCCTSQMLAPPQPNFTNPKSKSLPTNIIHKHPHPTIANNHVNITKPINNNNNSHTTIHSNNKHNTPYTNNQTTNHKHNKPQQITHIKHHNNQHITPIKPKNNHVFVPHNTPINTNQQSSITDVSYYYITTIEPLNPNLTSFTQLYNDFPLNFDTFHFFPDQLPIFDTSTYPSTTSAPHPLTST